MTLREVDLDDKYLAEGGRIYLTGTQALVRLPLEQRRRDMAAGLNTAGLISGYRGSPVGVYDQELWRVRRLLADHEIVFQPGLNEDLAATALWGAQQVGTFGQAKVDGVFGIWYGKNPGFDRSGDAIKHANFAGTSPRGGILAVIGDDHGAKSSTIPNQSDYGLMNHFMPTLFPSDVQDVLDFGHYGFALSRFSGCWVGFKVEPHIMDRSQTVDVGGTRAATVLPDDFALPPGGVGLRWPDNRFDQEVRMIDHKLPAIHAFVRANPFINRVVLRAARPRLGLVTAGKSYLDVREALAELGIDEAAAERLGLAVLKIGLTWPLEPTAIRDFCAGLDEVLVVEEKQPVLENQIRAILYNLPQRPRLVGKTDEAGITLLTAKGELDAIGIAVVLGHRLQAIAPDEQIEARLQILGQRRARAVAPPLIVRKPYFCSGCPHSTSVRHPTDSRASGGIGCHWMAVWTPQFDTEPATQMGGEGVHWLGQAPFVSDTHIFQNLGDGTYYHSGAAAIRAAVAGGVNITYKLLYNDAVAMTGGQPVEGKPQVPQITHQLAAEGVRRVVVVSDEPGKYDGATAMAPGVVIRPREELDAVQRELAATAGVTAIVYDQTCAAEKRRRRKKNEFPDPPRRMFINDLVCEGCGDCGIKSNCISIEPLETPFGRKRAINQSSCNKDYSCNNGFCPSFVTVENATLRKRAASTPPADLLRQLGDPVATIGDRPFNLLITGIGGTGVVTLGAVLGMAAHLDGRASSVLDSIGLAQKNGAVVSHVRIARDQDDLHSARVPDECADALIACDLVVAGGAEVMSAVRPRHTRAVVNQHIAPTADFVFDPDLDFQADGLKRRLAKALGRNRLDTIDAHGLAGALMGDAITMNLFMLGYAYQEGLVPLSAQSLIRAIELNGVSVETNKRAFEWGRIAAKDIGAVAKVAGRTGADGEGAETLDQIVERRAAFLVDYQDQAYSQRYRRLVERVAAHERRFSKLDMPLTEAVARSYFKLLAYKDEYEVARLHADPTFARKLAETFEDGFAIRYNLAPPLLSAREHATGLPAKRSFGGWMGTVFRMLARMKPLRGTVFDPFGYQRERRTERRLIAQFEAVAERLLSTLTSENRDKAAEIAQLPMAIRGFGHVKDRSVEAAAARQAVLLASYVEASAAGQRPVRQQVRA